MDKEKRLWEPPDGRDGLSGNLGLTLMGGAMLSKSLIQFSVDGWGCLSSLLFGLSQTMVGIMAVMVTFSKRTYVSTVVSRAPDPLTGTVNS